MRRTFSVLFVVFLFVVLLQLRLTGEAGPKYIGSEGCKNCHEKEYQTFTTYSKKTHSYQSVARRKTLTADERLKCFECHTTGYRQPGGFVSAESTPQLMNAGCEVCHGPGSRHAESGNPADIKGKVTPQDCEKCHDNARVAAFRFKPLVFGGVH